MTPHDTGLFDLEQAVKFAVKHGTLVEVAEAVINGLPSELRSMFVIEANTHLINTIK